MVPKQLRSSRRAQNNVNIFIFLCISTYFTLYQLHEPVKMKARIAAYRLRKPCFNSYPNQHIHKMQHHIDRMREAYIDLC
jgi:hypothetical protein